MCKRQELPAEKACFSGISPSQEDARAAGGSAVCTAGDMRDQKTQAGGAWARPRGGTTSEVTEQQLEDMEALLVPDRGEHDQRPGVCARLHGLSPSTLCFTDRPQRDIRHVMSQFVGNWAAGTTASRTRPGTLLPSPSPVSWLPEDAVVVIQDSRTWTETRSPTASELLDGALARPPPGAVWAVDRPLWACLCHRSRQPGCTGAGGRAGAAGPRSLAAIRLDGLPD